MFHKIHLSIFNFHVIQSINIYIPSYSSLFYSSIFLFYIFLFLTIRLPCSCLYGYCLSEHRNKPPSHKLAHSSPFIFPFLTIHLLFLIIPEPPMQLPGRVLPLRAPEQALFQALPGPSPPALGGRRVSGGTSTCLAGRTHHGRGSGGAEGHMGGEPCLI